MRMIDSTLMIAGQAGRQWLGGWHEAGPRLDLGGQQPLGLHQLGLLLRRLHARQQRGQSMYRVSNNIKYWFSV